MITEGEGRGGACVAVTLQARFRWALVVVLLAHPEQHIQYSRKIRLVRKQKDTTEALALPRVCRVYIYVLVDM